MNDLMRKATKEDIQRLVEIWQESFGDEKEYIGFFMSRRFDNVDTLVFEKNGTIVSQLFLISVSIKDLNGYYLYAAATDPEYRGEGIMSSLLEYAKKFATENKKDFIFLVPGTKSLYSYYKKFGYEESFAKYTVGVARDENSAEFTVSTDIDEAKSFLESFEDAVLWDSTSIDYVIDEFLTYRGKIFTLHNKALLMISDDETVLLCKECNFFDGVKMLFKIINADKAQITTCVSLGNRENGGMVLRLNEKASKSMFDDMFVLFAKE